MDQDDDIFLPRRRVYPQISGDPACPRREPEAKLEFGVPGTIEGTPWGPSSRKELFSGVNLCWGCSPLRVQLLKEGSPVILPTFRGPGLEYLPCHLAKPSR